MGALSIWHLLLLAVIVVLVFGGRRFSRTMEDAAKGIKTLREGLRSDDQ